MLNTPPFDKRFQLAKRVYAVKGIAPACNTCGGGWTSAQNICGVCLNKPSSPTIEPRKPRHIARYTATEAVAAIRISIIAQAHTPGAAAFPP